MLVAAMAERLVLHASADLVDRPVGHPRHVEGIGDLSGVGKVRVEPRSVGVGQVEGHDPHPPPPPLRAVRRPSPQLGCVFSLEEVDHDPGVEVHEGRCVDGGVRRRRREIGVLIDPEGGTGPTRRWSSTRGRPWKATDAQAVSHPTPYSVATEATDRQSSPTWRVISTPARTVRTWRGAMPSIRSVQVFAQQPFRRHRQRRFLTTSRVGRPKPWRSRRWTSTRSWASARFRHDGQLAFVRVDSTVITRSPGTSSTARTTTPGSPSIFSARPIPSSTVRDLLRRSVAITATMPRSLAVLVDVRQITAWLDPHSNRESLETAVLEATESEQQEGTSKVSGSSESRQVVESGGDGVVAHVGLHALG